MFSKSFSSMVHAACFLPPFCIPVVVSLSTRFSLFPHSLCAIFLRDWVSLDLGFSRVGVDYPCHYAKSEPIRYRLNLIFEYNVLSKHTKIKRYTGSLARNSGELSSRLTQYCRPSLHTFLNNTCSLILLCTLRSSVVNFKMQILPYIHLNKIPGIFSFCHIVLENFLPQCVLSIVR